MIIPTDNLSLYSASYVQSICRSLFLETEISFYHYARVYDDGSTIGVVSNVGWHQYFFQHDFHLHSVNNILGIF